MRLSRSTRSTLVLASLLFAVLPGCTADPGDEVDSGEAAYRSKPNGPDQSGGSLSFLAPPATGAALGQSKLTMEGSTVQVDLWKPVTGLRVGEQRFYVGSSGGGVDSKIHGSIAMGTGTDVQVPLAGVRINRLGMPITFGVGSSDPLAFQMTKAAPSKMVVLDSSLTVSSTASGAEIAAVAPGTYAIRFSWGDGIVLDAAAGATSQLDAWDYAQRRVARLVPPTRELPDACKDGYSMSVGGGAAGTAFAFHDQAIEFGQNEVIHQRDFRTPSSEIKVHFPCVSTLYSLPLGNKGAGPTLAKIGRLDVDDVDVTMPDGSKKKVRGTYRVVDAQGNGILRDAYPTNTGIDLPPGTYKLHVDYPQSAGTNGSYEETFTVP